jgi:hypothetical protein
MYVVFYIKSGACGPTVMMQTNSWHTVIAYARCCIVFPGTEMLAFVDSLRGSQRSARSVRAWPLLVWNCRAAFACRG